MIKLLIALLAVTLLLVDVAPARAQSLRDISLFRNRDIQFILTVDDSDVIFARGEERIRENAIPRIVGGRFIKRTDEPFKVTLFQEGVGRLTFDSEWYSRETTVHINTFLDTTKYANSLTFSAVRTYQYPTRPRSVGAGTNETSATVDAGSITTASFTPSNALIVVSVAGSSGTVAASDSISDTFSDTLTCNQDWTSTDSVRVTVDMYTCTGWTSGAGTITVSWSGGAAKASIIVDTFSGVHSTPVSETNIGTGTASTLSVSLVGVAADNRSVGAVGSRQDDDGITPGTNENELVEIASSGGGGRMRLQTQYGASAGQDATVDWSGLNTLNNSGGGLELAAAAAGAARRIIRID